MECAKNAKMTFLESKEDKIVSRIIEIELYLTKKIIENRGKGYKPKEGDEDQPLRDELLKLRKQIGILKWKKEKKTILKYYY